MKLPPTVLLLERKQHATGDYQLVPLLLSASRQGSLTCFTSLLEIIPCFLWRDQRVWSPQALLLNPPNPPTQVTPELSGSMVIGSWISPPEIKLCLGVEERPGYWELMPLLGCWASRADKWRIWKDWEAWRLHKAPVIKPCNQPPALPTGWGLFMDAVFPEASSAFQNQHASWKLPLGNEVVRVQSYS